MRPALRDIWARISRAVVKTLRRPKPVSAWVAGIVYLLAAPKLAPLGSDDSDLDLWFLSAVFVFGLWTAVAWWLQDLRRPPPVSGYHVFTRQFDRVVHAADLDSVLTPLSDVDRAALDEAWTAFSGALEGWRTKAHSAALEASVRIRQAVSPERLEDTTVSLRIDQSGSMRGQTMLLAAAAADVAGDFLAGLGVSVEVLGFTTRSWRGGESRRQWQDTGRPSNPGRLCDLLHIIYRSTDAPGGGTGGWDYRPMLRPDLPKENIDGEAVEWAAGRLMERPRPHKLLIIVSDGAPVDDSTLTENHGTFLVDHLMAVLERLDRDGDIRVAAIGIGFDVDRYYSVSARVATADDLGLGVIGLLERALIPQLPADRGAADQSRVEGPDRQGWRTA